MRVLSSVFNGLIVSILLSAVLFIASYSVFTGEFPPNFAKMKASLSIVQQFIANMQQIKLIQGHSPGDEGALRELETLRNRQVALLEQVSGSTVVQKSPSLLEERLAENERRISILQTKVEALILELQALRGQPGKQPAPASH